MGILFLLTIAGKEVQYSWSKILMCIVPDSVIQRRSNRSEACPSDIEYYNKFCESFSLDKVIFFIFPH